MTGYAKQFLARAKDRIASSHPPTRLRASADSHASQNWRSARGPVARRNDDVNRRLTAAQFFFMSSFFMLSLDIASSFFMPSFDIVSFFMLSLDIVSFFIASSLPILS